MHRPKPRWPLGRRLLKRCAAPIAVIMVFAMFAVANKTAWELGPEWCARYMLVKFVLHMEEGLCSGATIEPPTRANPTLSGKVAVGGIEPF